jgi:hypothetical protein
VLSILRLQRDHRIPCSSVVVVCLFLFVLLAFPACHRSKPNRGADTQRYVGFSVFGPHWPQEKTFANESEHLQYLETQGYLVAQYTSRLYGNAIRVPISPWVVLRRDILAEGPQEFAAKPAYKIDDEVLNATVKRIHHALESSRDALEKASHAENDTLGWRFWDAFFSGVQAYNRELEASPHAKYRPVFVNLLLVDRPPALILEAPAGGTRNSVKVFLAENGFWDAYRRLYITFVRKLIQRYGKEYIRPGVQPLVPLVIAVELFNEPDYVWLPDEALIEKALDADVYPCDKYLTQLYLSQIPENDLPAKACIRRHGMYLEQDLGFSAAPTPLRNFRWGIKFDKYVAAFADLHEHVSFAAKDEIAKGAAKVRVISSAVTHVNLDWFRRMFQANATTFSYVDAVAIHPYHWPRHDIHDMQFIGAPFEEDWTTMSPRAFASQYCKRFDFLTVLASLVTSRSVQRSYGLARKAIWVTEFGIPTKKVGRDNSAETLQRYPVAIYERAASVPEGITAIRWEDKWQAFFDQVSAEFLRQNQVEAFFVYTLRESAENETNDDNHSNFALYRSDWSSRVEPETLTQLADFFLRFRTEKK